MCGGSTMSTTQVRDCQKTSMRNNATWKVPVFAVTLAGVQALDHGTSWRHYDHSFVGRNYFRVQGTGSM